MGAGLAASQLPRRLSYLSPAPCGSRSGSLPPNTTEPRLSCLLQTMAAMQFLTLLAENINQQLRILDEDLDEATRECKQQCVEHLRWAMTRLLRDLEQRIREQSSQERSSLAWGALLFSALQQWQFWAAAAVLLLLFVLCWWLRKSSHGPARSLKEDSSRSKADKEEQEGKSSVALEVGRISTRHLWDLPLSFTMVRELVDELPHICRSRKSFMLQLKPAFGVGSTLEGWGPCEDDAVYRLLVPLQPSQGHAFHLELGTAQEMPARKSRLRVELERTCIGEQFVEDVLCFLHHLKDDPRKNQGSSLLDTLCTGPYLDLEKTMRLFQILVKAAWVVLPPPKNSCMTVLPSRHSCRLQLMHPSQSTILIQLMFGVQQRDLDAFLSIE